MFWAPVPGPLAPALLLPLSLTAATEFLLSPSQGHPADPGKLLSSTGRGATALLVI